MKMPLLLQQVWIEKLALIHSYLLTDSGPRMRAPLGMKTTNAKSNAFQTPAPVSASGKTQKASPRLRRPKVKVHQPEAEIDVEDDVPEVEYMPPKEIPLLDDMDDYLPRDWTIPKISHEAMVRGIMQARHNPIEDDGRTREQRRFEEEVQRERKQRDKEWDKIFEAQMAKDEAETRRYMGMPQPSSKATKSSSIGNVPQRIGNGVSTIQAKSAAAALSPVPKRTFTAPTAATKSRLPTGFVSSKKIVKPLAQSVAPRQAAAVAASRSTIGYAQGRAGRTPVTVRKPLSNVTKPAPFSTTTTRRPTTVSSTHQVGTMRSRGPMSRCSSTSTNATLVTPLQEEESYRTAEEVEREMELLFLSRSGEEEEEEAAWMNSFSNQLQIHDSLVDELEDFEFQLPQGF